MLRDSDIRAPLHGWLENRFRKHRDTRIVYELNVPRPSARIDVAVINGEMSGFEIKSDADSLVRLPRQIRSFNAIFDKIYLVTTRRHYELAKNLVPAYWGLAISSRIDNRTHFLTRRKAQSNTNYDIEALLHLLTRNEQAAIAKKIGCIISVYRLRRHEIVDLLLKELDESEIKSHVRQALKVRASS